MYWPFISRYRAAVRTQSPKVEMIANLFKLVENPENKSIEDKGIVRELLLDFYKSSGNRKPHHNVSVYSCGDSSLRCSCGDCPSSPVCAESSSTPQKSHSFSVRIGALKVKCIEFSLEILYIGVISVFFRWGWFKRTQNLRYSESRTNPFSSIMDECGFPSVKKSKGESHSVQIPDEMLQRMKGIQVSVLQSYLASFYRRYGTWFARNPTLPLCSSLAIVLLFSLGLIYFEVETDPEKLWVGHGSKYAEEKHFFDTHMASFYRIEQLILGTIPNTKYGKSPFIVTEENIRLLFEIQKKVDGILANYSDSLVSLKDICLKPVGQDCATQSILQGWG